jgi:TetR/AcrR family transcriptional regulator, regulator of cefoperazone and chloramphenicol sensitivity
MLPQRKLSAPTPERVLRVAGQVFAEVGFRDTTIRDICQRAGVNVAAVNYHFGSKESLYGAVITLAFQESNDRHPLTVALNADAPPEARLSDFVHTFVRRLLDDHNDSWQGRLIAREIMDPTGALENMIEVWIRPRLALLRQIISELVPDDCEDLDLQRYLLSIIGQCLVYRHSRSVVDRLCPGVIRDEAAIERTAAHVTRFCLAGLRDGLQHAMRHDPT